MFKLLQIFFLISILGHAHAASVKDFHGNYRLAKVDYADDIDCYQSIVIKPMGKELAIIVNPFDEYLYKGEVNGRPTQIKNAVRGTVSVSFKNDILTFLWDGIISDDGSTLEIEEIALKVSGNALKVDRRFFAGTNPRTEAHQRAVCTYLRK